MTGATSPLIRYSRSGWEVQSPVSYAHDFGQHVGAASVLLIYGRLTYARLNDTFEALWADRQREQFPGVWAYEWSRP